MVITTKLIDSADTMERLGEELADTLTPGNVVYLRGDLGAGKTTLARGIIRALGHNGSIPSPTYTIINSYDTNPTIHHLDLYRLNGEDDYFQSGLGDTDTAHSIWLVEWPDKALSALPTPTLELTLSIQTTGHLLEVINNTP